MVRKNHMIPVVMLAAVLTCCMAGCDDDNPVRPYDTSNIYPLAVGNFWVRQLETWVADSLYSTYDPETTFVDTSITWHGRTWYGESGAEDYLLNDVGGVWNLRFDDDDYPGGDSCLMIMYPASVGDSWVHEFENDTYEVLATSESVTTPAGQFNGCYKLLTTNPNNPNEPVTVWFKPEVGLIKVMTEVEYYDSDLICLIQLLEYHLE